jgi:nitrogen-specific signal transduction histidine kinase
VEIAAAKDKAFTEPMDLVLALGHEIGNLLAATRLHAHLIDADTTATELSELSATIGELSSRMGSLLAQIRPLVSPVPEGAPNVDPIGVLDGVRCGVEESCDARVAVDLESAAGLPMAAIDPEPLHHILLTSVYQALEESAPTGRVAVSAVAQAESIVFRVDGETELEADAGSALRGRALLHAVADAILRPRRGQIAAHSLGSGHRVELTVPAARPERA